MITSIDAKKAYDKVQYPFIIKKKKTLNKVHLEGAHLNIINVLCEKPTVNSYPLGEN